MKRQRWLRGRRLAAFAPIVVAAALAAPAVAQAHGYRQTNLVSDQPGVAQVMDPNLVNPWGLAAGPTTPLWAADNGTGVASIYPGAVGGMPITIAPLVVTIPAGAPTGQVFNPTSGFKVDVAGTPTPALFIFDSEAGTISAWAPASPVPPTSATTEATVPTAIFKGLALARVHGHGPMLFAADFHNNAIDVFNNTFHQVNTHGGFRDRHLPAHFAPFGIQAIGGKLYVTYAKQDAMAEDEVDAAHLGYVDVYTTKGHLIRRLVSRGALNAPWGLVQAPRHFGQFSGALLVGNFGDGRIHAYNIHTGHMLGTLRRPSGAPVVIDGLWGLRFGNGVTGARNALLFSAGPDGEAHGLLGSLRHAG
jgi:uncharacterized protein (TIGR03118 family)